MLRGAEIAHAPVRLAREKLHDGGREAGFPDTGFAGKQHYVSVAGYYLGPPPKQQFGLFFASDEGGHAGGV
jgi:hypothetical protein